MHSNLVGIISPIIFFLLTACSKPNDSATDFVIGADELECQSVQDEKRESLEGQIGTASLGEESFIVALVNCNGSIVGESKIFLDGDSKLKASIMFVTNALDSIEYSLLVFVDDVDITSLAVEGNVTFGTSSGLATTVPLELDHIKKRSYRLTLIGIDTSGKNQGKLYNNFAVNYDIVTASSDMIPSESVTPARGEQTNFDPNPYYIAYSENESSNYNIDLWVGALYAENNAGLLFLDYDKKKPISFECGEINKGILLFAPSSVDQPTVLNCSFPSYVNDIEDMVALLIPDFFAPPGEILPLFSTLVRKDALR